MVDGTQPASAPGSDDAVPVIDQKEPVSRVGDVWRLGEHSIACGDARDAAVYKTLLGDQLADLVWTDPPYNVPVQGHICGRGEAKHGEFVMASGEMDEAQFSAFLEAFLAHTTAFVRPGAIQFVCMDWRHVGELLGAGKRTGLELKNLCVW